MRDGTPLASRDLEIMSTLATSERGDVRAVNIKDVLSSSRASDDISSIRLREDIDLSGPFGIMEGCACGSAFRSSYTGMFGSATMRLLW